MAKPQHSGAEEMRRTERGRILVAMLKLQHSGEEEISWIGEGRALLLLQRGDSNAIVGVDTKVESLFVAHTCSKYERGKKWLRMIEVFFRSTEVVVNGGLSSVAWGRSISQSLVYAVSNLQRFGCGDVGNLGVRES